MPCCGSLSNQVSILTFFQKSKAANCFETARGIIEYGFSLKHLYFYTHKLLCSCVYFSSFLKVLHIVLFSDAYSVFTYLDMRSSVMSPIVFSPSVFTPCACSNSITKQICAGAKIEAHGCVDQMNGMEAENQAPAPLGATTVAGNDEKLRQGGPSTQLCSDLSSHTRAGVLCCEDVKSSSAQSLQTLTPGSSSSARPMSNKDDHQDDQPNVVCARPPPILVSDTSKPGCWASNATYLEAVAQCNAMNVLRRNSHARLCTRIELYSGICCEISSECAMDQERIWTSESCGMNYFVVRADTTTYAPCVAVFPFLIFF